MVLHFLVKGKSALWSHLLAFQRECEEVEEVAPTYSQDTNSLSPLAGMTGRPLQVYGVRLGQCCRKVYGHLATKPSCHQTISPPDHLQLPPNHLATKPSRHQTISPPNHLATKPSRHQRNPHEEVY